VDTTLPSHSAPDGEKLNLGYNEEGNSAANFTGNAIMTNTIARRLGLGFALLMTCVPLIAAATAQQQPAFKPQYFNGKVVPLATVLEKQGAKLDADAAAHWMALVAEDGKIYPLIKDDGSRMFFKDKTLLNRSVRLTGRLIPETQLLQVVNVHSYVKGQLCEVYYWCDICSIRGYELTNCGCCGDIMVLKEVPLK
jgi:hypothetical protein